MIKDLNSHIPTEEIKQDILDTQKEINDYKDEKEILMRNPSENRVKIYFLEGRISNRSTFIDQLQKIIDLRINNANA